VNDRLAAALLGVLGASEEPEALRARAAIALGPALEQADTYGFEDPDDVLVSADMFRRVKQALRALFHDATVPKDVRRRVLEASVRAPQRWHADAVREAYAGDDEAWKLTAVFCMKYVRGFDDEIVAALSSDTDAIRYQALRAAGAWGVKAAWPHVAAVLAAGGPDKDLLLAAIDAAASIRPAEASDILERFSGHDDEDVVEAALEALAMAGHDPDDDLNDSLDDDLDDAEGEDERPSLPPHLLS
jgi:hypothetical protein